MWDWRSADPFGATPPDETAGGSAFVFNLRFPGQYFDKETGLAYNVFRDYDPGTGRYIESDPIGLEAGQFSTYGYVDGNPNRGVDPVGLADLTKLDRLKDSRIIDHVHDSSSVSHAQKCDQVQDRIENVRCRVRDIGGGLVVLGGAMCGIGWIPSAASAGLIVGGSLTAAAGGGLLIGDAVYGEIFE